MIRKATLLALLLLAGCGGSSNPATDRYLRALTAEQAKLAAAEQKIPLHPRTPAALSRSIGLLRGAINRLAVDLSEIQPPHSVAKLHQQLVSITRSYGAKLQAIARAARVRGRVAGAASELESSTDAASEAFGATVRQIDKVLGKT